MWIYQQSTGQLSTDDGTAIAVGYSGLGGGKNNPQAQNLKDFGPVPRGIYYLGRPSDTLTHGPFVLMLHPDPGNDMYGRSGFLIHGDSTAHAGQASQGCVVLDRTYRELMNQGPDRRLIVVA